MIDRPHYRDPDLTDEMAMDAMIGACNDATLAVLDARLDLLRAGIADTHPLCRVMDGFASAMTRVVTDGVISDPLPIIRLWEETQ